MTDDLQAFVGRTEVATDQINRRVAASFAAMFDDTAPTTDGAVVALPGLHFCLAPAITPASATGPDGHPTRGAFLPPIPLPRRMVAGGRVDMLDALRLGDTVTRRSTIRSIVMKEGRSGPLCFVSVEHRLSTIRGDAVVEQQELVYRGPATRGATAPAAEPAPAGEVSEDMRLSPVDLFRYSALTFNSHRIHYDQRYATEVEGYPGLLVHGTLQAILLMRLATRAGAPGQLRSFAFRAVAPLFDTMPFAANASRGEAGKLSLWIGSHGGRHMDATAEMAG